MMSMGAKSSIVKVAKLRFDTEGPFVVEQGAEWTRPLLDELQEDVDASDLKLAPAPSFISFSGHINKRKSTRYEEVVLLLGELKAQYLTHCVSTGKLMTDTITVEVNMAAIDQSNQEKYAYDEDVIEVEVDGAEHDLYYFQDNELDLLPIFHEYLFLNKDPYPRIDGRKEEEEEELE